MGQYYIPNIYAGHWYNGEEEKKKVYIGNKRSILLGMPRMRQVRVKESKYYPEVFQSVKLQQYA